MRAPDLTGRVFADLRVIRRDDARPGRRTYWIAACRCGSAPFGVLAHSLRCGRTTRCATCANAATPRKTGARYGDKTIEQWAAQEGVQASAIYRRLKRHGTVHAAEHEPPIDPKAWCFPKFMVNGVPTSPVWRRAVTQS